MTRDELVEAAAEALNIVEVIDAVEPLIRADERVKALEFCCADTAADLRAKVEALPHTNKCDTQDPVYAGRGKTLRCTCWQAEVLALFDGSSDERE